MIWDCPKLGEKSFRQEVSSPASEGMSTDVLRVLQTIEGAGGIIDVPKDVSDHLREGNVSLEEINAIIWSHHHLDHIGDPSRFPPPTALVVGPGFKTDQTTFPGYPANSDARTVDDAFHGRELVELDFSAAPLEIGGFPALDYFGDGSFYLLYTKGHSKRRNAAYETRLIIQQLTTT